LKEIYGDSFKQHADEQLNIIESISKHISNINANVDDMIDARKKANKIEDAAERADAYCHEVKPFFEEIRYHCDKLELLVDDELWPLTKYRELLFTR
jgi:glutamine synthetase